MTNKRTIDIITDLVCCEYRTDMGRLRSRCRRRELVEPRQFIMYFARRHTRLSLHNIADTFSLGHATAISGIRTINNLVQVNGYKSKAERMEQQIVDAVAPGESSFCLAGILGRHFCGEPVPFHVIPAVEALDHGNGRFAGDHQGPGE